MATARRKRAGADGGFTAMQVHADETAGPRTAEWPNLPGPSWRAPALLCLRLCVLSPENKRAVAGGPNSIADVRSCQRLAVVLLASWVRLKTDPGSAYVLSSFRRRESP